MRATSGNRGQFAIASHPIFRPALIGWAGLVLALVILVLPNQLIDRLSLLTGLSILGDNARYILAVLGAVIGGGIGFAIAEALAAAGAHVTIVGRDAGRVAQSVTSIEQAGGSCAGIAADLIHPDFDLADLGACGSYP